MDESISESPIAILRRETANLHRETEQIFPVMRNDLTFLEYGEVLRVLSEMYRRIEQQIPFCPSSIIQRFADERRRFPALEDDLSSLSFNSNDEYLIQQLPQPPLLESEASWLGTLYVTEGSRLGGVYIARHLEKHFGFSDGKGYSFFAGAGRKTREEWEGFCELCNELVDQTTITQVVDSAKLAFGWFGECFRSLDGAERNKASLG
jgi:heme oxygenase